MPKDHEEWEKEWKRDQGLLSPAAIEIRTSLTLSLEGDDADMGLTVHLGGRREFNLSPEMKVKIKENDLEVIAADMGKLILETLRRMTVRAGW